MPAQPIILSVDDNPGDAALMRQAFTKVGSTIEFVTMTDGRAAVRFLQRTAVAGVQLPALIMIDLAMPDFSGFEVLNAIRSDKRLRQISSIILTNSTNPEDEKRAALLGADAFIPKPQSWARYLELALNIANFVALE